MSSCVQRRTVASVPQPAAVVEQATGEPAAPWYAGRFVRLILVLLTLFFVLHLTLWKVVYDFIMDADHNRLQETAQTAWVRLKDTVTALD